MPARAATLFGLTAMLLLGLVAVDLVAWHMILPACGDPGGCDAGDQCLCCCRHVVVVPPLVLKPGLTIELFPPAAEAGRTSAVSLPLDHPPRG